MAAPLFPLGALVATPGALAALDWPAIADGIARHWSGDWGELDDEDRATNDWSLVHGERLLSAYVNPEGVKFWIITERDRSATTVLLPEEY